MQQIPHPNTINCVQNIHCSIEVQEHQRHLSSTSHSVNPSRQFNSQSTCLIAITNNLNGEHCIRINVDPTKSMKSIRPKKRHEKIQVLKNMLFGEEHEITSGNKRSNDLHCKSSRK